MSIFSKIRDAIFNRKPAASAGTPVPGTTGAASTTTASTAPAGAAAQPAPMNQVDVETILTQLSDGAGQKLNWRTSIVDLMKLVGMESSLDERRDLAQELGYTGSTSDTATMNIWLHKQVMKKLAENGGKVPASMLD